VHGLSVVRGAVGFNARVRPRISRIKVDRERATAGDQEQMTAGTFLSGHCRGYWKMFLSAVWSFPAWSEPGCSGEVRSRSRRR
jgi:hypothetical protein